MIRHWINDWQVVGFTSGLLFLLSLPAIIQEYYVSLPPRIESVRGYELIFEGIYPLYRVLSPSYQYPMSFPGDYLITTITIIAVTCVIIHIFTVIQNSPRWAIVSGILYGGPTLLALGLITFPLDGSVFGPGYYLLFSSAVLSCLLPFIWYTEENNIGSQKQDYFGYRTASRRLFVVGLLCLVLLFVSAGVVASFSYDISTEDYSDPTVVFNETDEYIDVNMTATPHDIGTVEVSQIDTDENIVFTKELKHGEPVQITEYECRDTFQVLEDDNPITQYVVDC